MKHLTLCIIFILAAATAVTAAAPEYTVMRTTGKIVIDGILDEADWAQAEPVGEFQFPWWTAGDKEQTEVKILWDDNYLYLAYSCSDKNIWAEIYDTNGRTYNDDAVEIFWDPSGGVLTGYNQCEVNCIGNMLSVNNPARDTLMTPRIGRRIDGTVNNDNDTDKGWVVEMLIRFDEYEGLYQGDAPDIGDIWKIGLNRCGGKKNAQYSQWSPSQTDYPSFHQPDDFGKIIFSSLPAGTVSVNESDSIIPEALTLSASPNPFNPTTTISYVILQDGVTLLSVFDITGQKVADLVDSSQHAGSHTVVWNGRDTLGNALASGIYFARLNSGDMAATTRMTLLK